MSMSQRIENGILVSYITDIMSRYARSFMLFTDLLFILVLFIMIVASNLYINIAIRTHRLLEHVAFECAAIHLLYS